MNSNCPHPCLPRLSPGRTYSIAISMRYSRWRARLSSRRTSAWPLLSQIADQMFQRRIFPPPRPPHLVFSRLAPTPSRRAYPPPRLPEPPRIRRQRLYNRLLKVFWMSVDLRVNLTRSSHSLRMVNELTPKLIRRLPTIRLLSSIHLTLQFCLG